MGKGKGGKGAMVKATRKTRGGNLKANAQEKTDSDENGDPKQKQLNEESSSEEELNWGSEGMKQLGEWTAQLLDDSRKVLRTLGAMNTKLKEIGDGAVSSRDGHERDQRHSLH